MKAPRLGICCPKERLQTAQQLGYDYAEMSLTWLESISDEEYDSILPLLSEEFKVEAVNGLLPGDRIHLSDDQYDPALQAAYLDKALARAEKLGVKSAVFGSGAARRFVPGFPEEKALEQIFAFSQLLAKKAADHGILAVLEPLNHKECNNYNSVAEGYELAKKVAHPAFGVLADFYHMAMDKEPLSNVVEAAPLLWHCHISSPDRSALSEKDRDFCREIAQVLRSIGYDRRISLEASIRDFEEDAASSIAIMKEYFGA